MVRTNKHTHGSGDRQHKGGGREVKNGRREERLVLYCASLYLFINLYRERARERERE